MNIDEKLERAKQAVTLLARHDDQHVLGRVAQLEKLKAHVDSEIAEAQARAAAPPPAEG